jgi:hypothetical protein
VAVAPAASGGGGATPAPATDGAAAARPAAPRAASAAHGGAAGLAEQAELLAAEHAGAEPHPHALLPPVPAASGGDAAPHPVAPLTEEALREQRKQGIADFKEAVDVLCDCLTEITLAGGSEEENARARYTAAIKQMTRRLVVCAKQHGAVY